MKIRSRIFTSKDKLRLRGFIYRELPYGWREVTESKKVWSWKNLGYIYECEIGRPVIETPLYETPTPQYNQVNRFHAYDSLMDNHYERVVCIDRDKLHAEDSKLFNEFMANCDSLEAEIMNEFELALSKKDVVFERVETNKYKL